LNVSLLVAAADGVIAALAGEFQSLFFSILVLFLSQWLSRRSLGRDPWGNSPPRG